MDYSTPGFPILCCLLEFAQTYVHWVGDAVPPSHPLLPPSPLALNLSQHQAFFPWVSSSHQVARVLELQLQHQSFHVHNQLQELAQTHVCHVGDATHTSHPLLSPSPPAFSLSQYQDLFQWVSFSHQVAKVLELQLQHPTNEYSGLISFRIDWFDLLAVKGTLKILLQHHSSKGSILQRSAFFMV